MNKHEGNPTTDEVSTERRKNFEIARENLKKLVAEIQSEKLLSMVNDATSLFIVGCGGDVEKYIALEMKGNGGNTKDMATFYVTEDLKRLIKIFEEKK